MGGRCLTRMTTSSVQFVELDRVGSLSPHGWGLHTARKLARELVENFEKSLAEIASNFSFLMLRAVVAGSPPNKCIERTDLNGQSFRNQERRRSCARALGS